MTVTVESLTSRHIEAVQRYAKLHGKKTPLGACERAARRSRGSDLHLGAMRTVAEAWNRLNASGFFGPPGSSSATPEEPTTSRAPVATRRLDLDEVEHMAVLSPGGGPVTRALVRRVRVLEAKVRATGEALANFVGEDADEKRELAAMSRDLVAVADAGTEL